MKSDRRRSNPSSILYWADLRNDPKLRRCSPAAKGLWAVHMLPAAAESPEYGVVILDGVPSLRQDLGELFSREIGESPEAAQALVDELVQMGAASVDDKGRVYCRRMVREEDLRKKRAAAGRLGAAAKHGKGVGKPSGKVVGKGAGKPLGKQGGNEHGTADGKSESAESALSASGPSTNSPEAIEATWQIDGEGDGKTLPPSLPSLSSHPSQYDSDPYGSGADAPADLTKLVFDQGLAWLRTVTEKSPAACRNMIGGWRKKLRNDDVALLPMMAQAQRLGIQHPESWMSEAIRTKTGTGGRASAMAKAIERFSQQEPSHGG